MARSTCLAGMRLLREFDSIEPTRSFWEWVGSIALALGEGGLPARPSSLTALRQLKFLSRSGALLHTVQA